MTGKGDRAVRDKQRHRGGELGRRLAFGRNLCSQNETTTEQYAIAVLR